MAKPPTPPPNPAPWKCDSNGGGEHVYNVECRPNPIWTNTYEYRNICACGDVQIDWHR